MLLGYQVGRLQLALQGAAQLADRRRYRGGQGGAGLWLVLVWSLGMTAGVEVVGRAGQLDGEAELRTAWAVVLGLGALDEWGFRGGVGYLLGDGTGLPRSVAIIQMGVSYGRPYKKPEADPLFMSPAPVPPWLMRLYGKWFPSLLVDPVLLPSGLLIDDDGTPLYEAADPDPRQPGLLRLRRSGRSFAAGTHFYRAGRWLLTEDGQPWRRCLQRRSRRWRGPGSAG